MGVVYRAHDAELERKVALKLLSARCLEDKERRARLLREARAAAAVNHPNVATLYGVVDAGERGVGLVMEYVEGETLRTAEVDVEQVALQVAEGLKAAHAAGVVHRDLKPDNVMLRADGLVKVLDFGLAMSSSSQGVETKSGTVLGTPRYMSPEQARGEKADARSDVFAFGVMVYELLAGTPPFVGDSDLAVLNAIQNAEPQKVSGPKRLVSVVERCLQKDPAQRFADGAELVAALRGEKLAKPGVKKRRWPRRVALGLAAMLVGVSTCSGVVLWSWGSAIRGDDVQPAMRNLRLDGLSPPVRAAMVKGLEAYYSGVFGDAIAASAVLYALEPDLPLFCITALIGPQPDPADAARRATALAGRNDIPARLCRVADRALNAPGTRRASLFGIGTERRLGDELLEISRDEDARYNERLLAAHMAPDEARSTIAKALVEEDPRVPMAWWLYIDGLGRLGRVREAVDANRLAVKANPESAWLRSVLVATLIRDGQLTEARRWYEEVKDDRTFNVITKAFASLAFDLPLDELVENGFRQAEEKGFYTGAIGIIRAVVRHDLHRGDLRRGARMQARLDALLRKAPEGHSTRVHLYAPMPAIDRALGSRDGIARARATMRTLSTDPAADSATRESALLHAELLEADLCALEARCTEGNLTALDAAKARIDDFAYRHQRAQILRSLDRHDEALELLAPLDDKIDHATFGGIARSYALRDLRARLHLDLEQPEAARALWKAQHAERDNCFRTPRESNLACVPYLAQSYVELAKLDQDAAWLKRLDGMWPNPDPNLAIVKRAEALRAKLQ
jgi:hypothetical protein